MIDTLAKVTGGLMRIVNLASAGWETIRRTLDGTYGLIDTPLNMVIHPLGQHHVVGRFIMELVEEAVTGSRGKPSILLAVLGRGNTKGHTSGNTNFTGESSGTSEFVERVTRLE